MKDPVCDMTVSPETPATKETKASYQGQTYYFCCDGCQKAFLENPEKYTDKSNQHRKCAEGEAPSALPMEGATRAPIKDLEAIYTCPMDPEIRQKGPGACPKCGMALEPEKISLTPTKDPELANMTRRFWISALLTTPLLLTTMLPMLWGGKMLSVFWQFVLSTPVVLWGGFPFFERAYLSLKNRSLNMFTLIGLGTSIAYLQSVYMTFFSVHAHSSSYFEAAASIVTLVLLGQMIELKAREQTQSAIRSLLDLTPPTAHRIKPQGEEVVAIEKLHIGDVLRIRPGEKIPVDGIVSEGHSFVDESTMTGESTPREKNAGDPLLAGTLNTTGAFLMKAEKVGAGTVLSQMISLVSQAQRSRAPIQNLADRVARYFVPIVLGISILTFLLWWFSTSNFSHALMSAISVLIIACPCALGLATPMSIMVAMGRGAREGLLIKNAEILQKLSEVKTLIFDKTGTLTEGHPQVVSILPTDTLNETEILRIAASLEKSSEHPLAQAIVKSAQQKNLKLTPIENFQSVSGEGVFGNLKNQKISLTKKSITPQADTLRERGETVVSLKINDQEVGLIGIQDPIKETTPEALASLKEKGLKLVMATGDHSQTASKIALILGLTEIHASLLPQDKMKLVEDEQKSGIKVAMSGDGINDTPALAKADVGVSMGHGTDIAIQASDITLVRGDLRGILRAIRLSEATLANIKQNLFLAFFYNALAIPIAAGVLYPIFGILLSPAIASAAMSFSSVSVIVNALRLKKKEL